MRSKQPVETREVTAVKLDAASRYVTSLEQIISRITLGMIKSEALHGDRDLLTLTNELLGISCSLAQPTSPKPEMDDKEEKASANLVEQAMELTKYNLEAMELSSSPTLIAEDLDQIIAELGPDFMKAKEDSLKSFALCHAVVIHEQRGAGRLDVQAYAVLEMTKRALALYELQLDAAKKLGEALIERLNHVPVEPGKKPTRKGRPRDPKVADRNKKMMEAWESGLHKTYADLGRAFGVKEDVARKAVRNAQRKKKHWPR